MKQELVYVNGDYFPRDEAKISVFDSGLMRGDTMTDAVRTFAHKPFRLDEHMTRLYKSMKAARYPTPMPPADMRRIVDDLIQRNIGCYAPEDDFWIVFNVTRGQGDLVNDPTQSASPPSLILFTALLDLAYWAPFYAEGCHAVTPFTRMAPPQTIDPKIKNRSRLFYTLADMEAKLVDPRAQCVLLDIDGNLAENKGGNFFIVSGGTVYTPTGRNVLRGVSRQVIFELCHELDVPCVERDLQPYDATTADEAFFTSTPYCIMPATKFNGQPIGDGKVGPVTKRLLRQWSERVGIDIAAQARRQWLASQARLSGEVAGHATAKPSEAGAR